MLKLLLVDDDEEEFDLLAIAVKEINGSIDVIHADGCNNILGIINNVQPDLIFLDINMPTVDGLECLKTIRSVKDLEKLPVIMYSTSNNKATVQQTFDNKANLYVVKSYSYKGLLIVLEKVLSINWKLESPKELEEFVIA